MSVNLVLDLVGNPEACLEKASDTRQPVVDTEGVEEQQNTVERVDAIWSRVTGTFYRAVDSEHRDLALSGSRFPGRYSTAEQPTLYLSSSPEGVAAAMIAHDSARAADLEIVTVEVDAERILDLRDQDACIEAAIDRDDAAAPWQEVVKAGGEPLSWRVRRQLDSIGANGLIDPSRKAPGLWHLALFRWNHLGDPAVSLHGI